MEQNRNEDRSIKYMQPGRGNHTVKIICNSKVMEPQRQVYSYLLSFRQEQVQSGVFIGCIWFVLFEKEWEGICRIELRWNVCV
jgi:hypothetical protein